MNFPCLVSGINSFSNCFLFYYCFMSSLCALRSSLLSDIWFACIFPYSGAYLFILFIEQKLLTLVRSNLSDFPFLILVSNLRTLYLSLGPKGFVLFFPRNFIILYLSSQSHFSWFLSEVSAWDWGGGGLVWLLPEDVRFLLHHLLKIPSFLYSIAFVSLSVIICELFHYKFNSNGFRINQLIYFILVELW